MNYNEPRIIFNPTEKEVEFMADHRVYVFKPGEKKTLDGFAAGVALQHTNAGLKEYSFEEDGAPTSSGIAYDKMAWRKLVSIASQMGVYEVGMKRDALIKALEGAALESLDG